MDKRHETPAEPREKKLRQLTAEDLEQVRGGAMQIFVKTLRGLENEEVPKVH